MRELRKKSSKQRREVSLLNNDDIKRDEIQRQQRKRIGAAVEDYMREDDDFENVDTYIAPDPDEVFIKLCEDGSEEKPRLSGGDGHNPPGKPPAPSEEEINKRRREIRKELIKGKKIHRDIMISTYFFVALFVGIIAYLCYFTYSKSDEFLASEYNSKRQSVYADKYIRGDIKSIDGEILATTKTDDDGKETRVYPFKNVFAHAVGYSTKGNTGIESIGNSYLLGSHTALLSQALSELKNQKIQGDTVVSTIDSRLQKAAYEALDGQKGAVIAMEVKTGKVLLMVSRPDFDPNKINEIWDDMVSDESNSNLVNRATQGLYPPGSTFKILTLLEYIRENPGSYDSFSYDCDSIYENGEYSIRCSKQVSHGMQDLKTAFANSCNGAFAVVGQSLKLDSLYDLCESMGYNSAIDTQLPVSKTKYSLTKDNASLWDVLQTSIGQGGTLTTPLLNLLIVSAAANDGVMQKPYIIDHIENANGSTVKTFSPENGRKVMYASEAKILGEYLRAVVTEGTGGNAEGKGYSVAGKTGSAEWSKGQDTHAWFVGYAPFDDPEIAVSVVVENAGSGGGVAAPIARAVFDEYFGNN